VAFLKRSLHEATTKGNAAVVRSQNQSEPHIVLHGDYRLTGSDGCNRMAGSYRLEGNTISFSQTASTMMACPEGMEQEQRFRNALISVAGYRIKGQHLEFLDTQGAMLVRFEAVALK
jgi:heat shock protein HslJ